MATRLVYDSNDRLTIVERDDATFADTTILTFTASGVSGTMTVDSTDLEDDITVNSITSGDSSLGITGLAATAATGGAIVLAGGATTTSGVGGLISVTGGAGSGTSAGGQVSLVGGASGAGATGNGGAALVTGGAALSTNGTGGACTVTGGVATGTGTGGACTITAGASAGAGGTAGSVNLASGAATGGTEGSVNIQTVATGKVSVFGVTPASRVSAYTQTYSTAAKTVPLQTATALTHSVGTADGTVDDVGGAFNQTTLNNNFKELTAQIAAIQADHLASLKLHNAIIDDLQTYGWFQ